MTAFLIALAWIASGYAVNAGLYGLMEHISPGYPVGGRCAGRISITLNMLMGPLGLMVLALFWWEYGRQPFRWDWPWLLRGES